MSADVNTEDIRRFLLGNLPEAERAVLEDRFLADEDLAAAALVVEDELIESYLNRELSTEDRRDFAAAYLSDPRRRERVAALQAVIAAANAETQSTRAESGPFMARLRDLFATQNVFPRYALAALAVIAIIGGVWFFLRLREQRPAQIAQGNTSSQPAPLTITSPSPTSGNLPSPAVTPSARPTLTQPETGPAIATMVLQPTLVRDPAAAKRLSIGPSVKQVRLQLNLERHEYKSYSVQITTVEGRAVWQGRSVGATGGSVVVSVPAILLPTNDYVVEVSGITSDGKRESVANYFLTAIRN